MLSVRAAFVVLALAGAVGCAETAPSRGQFGNVRLVNQTDEPGVGRAVVATFVFTPDGVKDGDSGVVFGAGNEVKTDFDDFTVDLVDRRGRVLAQYGIKDPRKAIIERQGWLERPAASHVARFAFKPDAASIRVLDAKRKMVAHAEITPLVEEFCRAHPGLHDC